MLDNCEPGKTIVTENDDDGGISTINQTKAQECYSNPCVGNHLVRHHVTDDSSAFTGEGTVTAHDSSEPAFGKISADSSSMSPDLAQSEVHVSAFEKTTISTEGQSDTMDVNEEVDLCGPKEKQLRQDCIPETCQICGQNSMDNSRAMVRFLPAGNAKTDVSLHVFCGKIASILPQIAQPHLEILVTAGLKNKHGIGPYVNFALARTRCAVAQGGEADKDPRRLDKEYYLVQEFEEHLKSIRGLQLNRKGLITSTPTRISTETSTSTQPSMENRTTKSTSSKPRAQKASRKAIMHKEPSEHQSRQLHQPDASTIVEKLRTIQPGPLQCVELGAPTHTNMIAPVHSPRRRQPVSFGRARSGRRADRKHQGRRVRCPCGGMYKGPSRWKAHVKTPRHLLWEAHTNPSPVPSCTMVDSNSNKTSPLIDVEMWQENSVGPQHIGGNQGRHARVQPHMANEEINHSCGQPQPGNGQGNYTITQPQTNEDQGNYRNENHLVGTGTIEGGDVVPRQDTTPTDSNSQLLSPSLLLLLLLLTPST